MLRFPLVLSLPPPYVRVPHLCPPFLCAVLSPYLLSSRPRSVLYLILSLYFHVHERPWCAFSTRAMRIRASSGAGGVGQPEPRLSRELEPLKVGHARHVLLLFSSNVVT